MFQAWQAFRAWAAMPRVRRFYPGGFQSEMNRREAALILRVRFYTMSSVRHMMPDYFHDKINLKCGGHVLHRCQQGRCDCVSKC
uniref:Uncharacterized protein n=1 Tax=Arundo donax TaxID=35708 RepID=A0A0A9DHJ3_ARUDO